MKIDILKYRELEKDRYLSCQKHPECDLLIWNYTQKCQFERMWTEETMTARGLITDLEGNVKSKPFKKFFNYEEHVGEQTKLTPLPIEDFEVFDKLDGSLGISYWVGDEMRVATRGSFTSDQALWATRKLKDYPKLIDIGLTFLWEIIYPENRIVVDYGGKEELILLAIIDTNTGDELPYEILPRFLGDWPIVNRFEGLNDFSKIKETVRDNAEGFVIRFKSGVRTKIKFAEYVRLHRLVTGVNAKTIWELLKNGDSFDDLLEKVPDEFYQWVKNTREKIVDEFNVAEAVAWKDFEVIKKLPSRRDQAIAIQQIDSMREKKLSGIIFKILDKKPYEEMIWKMIRPKADKPWKEDSDA